MLIERPSTLVTCSKSPAQSSINESWPVCWCMLPYGSLHLTHKCDGKHRGLCIGVWEDANKPTETSGEPRRIVEVIEKNLDGAKESFGDFLVRAVLEQLLWSHPNDVCVMCNADLYNIGTHKPYCWVFRAK